MGFYGVCGKKSIVRVPKRLMGESECFFIVQSNSAYWALVERTVMKCFSSVFPASHFPVVSTDVTDH